MDSDNLPATRVKFTVMTQFIPYILSYGATVDMILVSCGIGKREAGLNLMKMWQGTFIL